jgi:hypothetical protein
LGLFQFLRRPHEQIRILFARPHPKKAHRYDVPVYVLPGRVDPTIAKTVEEEAELPEEDESEQTANATQG